MPAPGSVSPDDPAAYKPRTEFDNTPWRFNMSQNGKKMTADEFSAWMKASGVRVARGAPPCATAGSGSGDVAHGNAAGRSRAGSSSGDVARGTPTGTQPPQPRVAAATDGACRAAADADAASAG